MKRCGSWQIGGACSALILTAQAGQAADGDNASSAGDIPEIVVTANKREENLNRVGLTITAIPASLLEERRVTTLEDVASAVPGLAFAPSTTNTPVFTLRGIGFNESSLGVYPAVSVYLDQIPLSFPVLASHAAFDLERVEVLKGPQGTLFGQNSTGGAINFIAAKPTKEFEAGGDLTYGRFNEVSANAYVGGALSSTVSARLAVTATNSDDWQYSYTRPTETNGSQSYVAERLQVGWEASDSLKLLFSANAWIDKSDPQALQLIAERPGVLPTADNILAGLAAVPFAPPGSIRAADWSPGIATPSSFRKFYQPALRVDFNITESIALTSLTSYSHLDQVQTTDGDGTYLVSIDLQKNDGYIHSFNQELRLASSDPHADFRWVGGANFERSITFEDQIQRYINQSNDRPQGLFINASGDTNKQDIRNYAFFTSEEYDVNSALTAKAAVRYTKSRIGDTNCGYSPGDGHVAELFNVLGNLLGTVPFTPIGPTDCYTLNFNGVPGSAFQSTLTQSNVSWRVGADYKLNSGALLYVNASRGFKAGSFPTLAAATFAQLEPVTQESVTAYEGGLKLDFLQRHGHLNAALFYDDYKDKQIRGKFEDPVFGLLDHLVNVPKSRVYGVDVDLTYKPLEFLTLSGATTYLASKITDFTGYSVVGTIVNFAGSPLPYTPRWSSSIDADLRLPAIGSGAPFAGLTVNYRSASDAAPGGSELTYPNDDGLSRGRADIEYVYRMPAYATVDARLGYESNDKKWRVMVWGKNILDKYYVTNVIPGLDTAARSVGPPGTYGVTFGVRYR